MHSLNEFLAITLKAMIGLIAFIALIKFGVASFVLEATFHLLIIVVFTVGLGLASKLVTKVLTHR